MDTPDNPPTEPQTVGKTQRLWLKWRLFIIGFLGWFLFEAVFWFFLRQLGSSDMAQLASINCISVLFTLGVMVYFGRNRGTRMISLGILTALAVNIFISQIVLGMIWDAICFKPFFIEGPIY